MESFSISLDFFIERITKLNFWCQRLKNFIYNSTDVLCFIIMDQYLINDYHPSWNIVCNQLSDFHSKQFKFHSKCLMSLFCYSRYFFDTFFFYEIPNILRGIIVKNSFWNWSGILLEKIIICFQILLSLPFYKLNSSTNSLFGKELH